MIMYKAFTAVVLAKVNFAGKNSETRTCKLYRQVEHEPLARAYPDYTAVQQGGIFNGMKQGIADSTSLELLPNLSFSAPTIDTHEMDISFSKIHFIYFLSGEMSFNNFDSHEVVCDMSDASVKVAQLSSDAQELNDRVRG
jgi:hypothetical protein